LHIVTCYVMLRSEQLLPNLLKRCKLSSAKLISKSTHVCGLSLDRQQSSKLKIVGQNNTNSWEHWTHRKQIASCVTACMRQLFAPFSAHRYQFWALLQIMHISTFTYQFYGAQLLVFSSEFGNNCLERNITEQITMCNCKIRHQSLTLCQFRIRKVILEKINTLMDRTLPNKCTKFGVKIFRSYWVITFLVMGHFLKPHPV